MALDTDQSTPMAANGQPDPANNCGQTNVRELLSAFNDGELRGWLMKCIEDGSENFLCAVAEAALAATAEDYVMIRPALLTLKRKHKSRSSLSRSQRASRSTEHRSAQRQPEST